MSWIWKRYQKPIYVTENGTTVKGETAPTPDVLNDTFRINFFEAYVGNLARAVKEDGIDIRSYFAWTLTDNWGTLAITRFWPKGQREFCCLKACLLTIFSRMGCWLHGQI